MPDLPLPKPTPPISSGAGLVQSDSGDVSTNIASQSSGMTNQSDTQASLSKDIKATTEVLVDSVDDSTPPPSAMVDSTTSSVTDHPSGVIGDTAGASSNAATNFHSSSFPSPVLEMRPPAVVTALSSVSSNTIPDQTETPVLKLEERGSSANIARPTSTASGSIPVSTNPEASKVVLSSPPPPVMAQPKKSSLRFLPIVVGAGVLMLIVVVVIIKLLGGSGSSGSPSADAGLSGNSGSVDPNNENPSSSTGTSAVPQGEPVVLEYWGLWEPEEVINPVLKDFESKNPGITVSYVKQNHRDYRLRLQTAIASKSGPDVFRFHASWAPMLLQELAPMPSSVLTNTDFESAFYPIANEQLNVNGRILGLPSMYEGLVLYYNKEIFSIAGLEPPRTWSELRTIANNLTIKTGGVIERGGVAIGTANNVEHFSDILALLMVQNGADLSVPESPESRDALLFYTNFVTKDGVWNSDLPSSTIAFARGDVAMMLAPSWRGLEVAQINPSLSFGTVPVPQLSDDRVTWGSFWAEGVNSFGRNQDQAWILAKYLSSAAGQKLLYQNQTSARSFGTAFSRVDLSDEMASHPVLGSLIQDAPYATGWFMSSYTHDAGLNDQIIKYYEDAINAVIGGEAVSAVLPTVSLGVNQVLQQYNLYSGDGMPVTDGGDTM